jgi:uncharacterized membrane protein YozB (DUF420 family)
MPPTYRQNVPPVAPIVNRSLASVRTMRLIALVSGAVIAIVALAYFDARIPYANVSVLDQWNAILEAIGVGLAYLLAFALFVVSSPNYQNRSRR